MMVQRDGLEQIGFYYPQEKIVAVTDVEKFKQWVGIDGDIPADELYAS
jgi:ribosomal protein S16